MPLIGYLHPGSPEPNSFLTEAFHKGLGEAGYVEGRNVVVEYRWAKYQYDRLPAMATDLVRLKVAVIAAMGGTFSGLAAVR
jgi:putative ABC transport system substrate-binding protein